MKKLALAILSLGLAACSVDYSLDRPPMDADGDYKEAADGSFDGPVPGGQGGSNSGIVTAGEWNDLDNWDFWSRLMTTKGDEQTVGFSEVPSRWGFWTNRRVAVSVKDAKGAPLPGVKVELKSDGQTLWTSVTDVLGRADCWIGLYDENVQFQSFSISLNGAPAEGEPAVTTWESEQVEMNEYTVSSSSVQASADILFIVDATGSMLDEIEFLKDDLADILTRAGKLELPVSLRTGALFYRDIGDDYITRESAFTDKTATTLDFIKNQRADGGGDWPEAVHTALEASIQKFKWNPNARARIAFMLLDAPPHDDVQGVMESVRKSISLYSQYGIKLIPVASSGIDKETEFLLRLFAIATDGTYVFITNDSGVGGDHIQATVGDYQVEKLNDLLVRLIQKYLV